MLKLLQKTGTTILIIVLFYAKMEAADTVEQPIVLNHSESVQPGETFGLQGHAFGISPEVWLSRIRCTEKSLRPQIKLPLLTKSEIYIAARIPADIEAGLYAVWVISGGRRSPPVYLNRARAVTCEYNEVMPGTVFRIFGRNLNSKGQKSRLYFLGMADGNRHQANVRRIPAKVLKADAYELQVMAPAKLDSGTYRLLLSNGYAAGYGETLFDEPIHVRDTAADPFQTGLPWGGDFNFAQNIYNVKTDPRLRNRAIGDGEHNDRSAIQEAIDSATLKGGVVYLPQGNYKLLYTHGSGLLMRSRVMIRGEGAAKTVIKFGYGPAFSTERVKAVYGWTLGWPDSRTEGIGILWPGGITTSGMEDLTLQNVNESGSFMHTVKNMPEGGSKVIFQRCTFDLDSGWGLAMVNISQLLFSDCIFKSTAMDVRGINAPTRTWPWDLKNSSNLIFRNNVHYYRAGRFGANGCHHAIFEGNTFIRDGDHQSKGETGGLSLDYTLDIVVQNNQFDVKGAAIKNANQGETILSQGGNAHQQNIGEVTRAAGLEITDRHKEWQDFTDRISTDWQYAIHPSNYCIAIVAGRGTGQWRTITWNNDSCLTIDKPWQVLPAPGSKYVITQWSAQQMLVRNNLLSGNNRGIWFYSGGTDLAIVNNRLINSEGIYIRSDQRLATNRYNLGWNILIKDNHLIDSDGKRPAYVVSWLAKSKNESLFGTGTLGMEIRNNELVAFRPNVKTGALIKSEGYFNDNTEDIKPKSEAAIAGILGSILEKNQAKDTVRPYTIGTLARQTTIDGNADYKLP